MSSRHAKFKTTPPLVTRLIVRPINKTNDLKYDKGEYKTAHRGITPTAT
jgi:hypothetical protein